jgi:hypothetical protein
LGGPKKLWYEKLEVPRIQDFGKVVKQMRGDVEDLKDELLLRVRKLEAVKGGILWHPNHHLVMTENRNIYAKSRAETSDRKKRDPDATVGANPNSNRKSTRGTNWDKAAVTQIPQNF